MYFSKVLMKSPLTDFSLFYIWSYCHYSHSSFPLLLLFPYISQFGFRFNMFLSSAQLKQLPLVRKVNMILMEFEWHTSGILFCILSLSQVNRSWTDFQTRWTDLDIQDTISRMMYAFWSLSQREGGTNFCAQTKTWEHPDLLRNMYRPDISTFHIYNWQFHLENLLWQLFLRWRGELNRSVASLQDILVRMLVFIWFILTPTPSCLTTVNNALIWGMTSHDKASDGMNHKRKRSSLQH